MLPMVPSSVASTYLAIIIDQFEFRSTNNTDAIKLDPIYTDKEKMCGNKLEFQIIAGAVGNNGIDTIKVEAENVDLQSYDSDAPAVVEYLLHVRPVHHMEILGLKTDLVAGSDAVPFGIAGYDAEEHEFDTLDGLQVRSSEMC